MTRAKKIKLDTGNYAIVDAVVYPILKDLDWILEKQGNNCYATLAGTNTKMHQLLMPVKKGQVIDHKNSNGLDNRLHNLRVCSNQQNSFNRAKHRGGTSKYKGVYWDKDAKKWRAEVMRDRVRHKLGRFNSEEAAAVAYDTAALMLFGEFARINFPGKAKEAKINPRKATSRWKYIMKFHRKGQE
jgi:hypothetical protein